MAIKLNFDSAGNLETPTLVLALKSGKRLGAIQNPQDLIVSDSFGNAPEFSFSVTKSLCASWHLIRNLRLIWVREWDKWFELTVDVNESNTSIKNVMATHLPEAELSQINLYGVEINTEADIDRDDYVDATVFFNASNPEASLLHRITKDAVNFVFGHIDTSLCHIQRTFTFDKKDIYSAFKEIEEEIGCHFEFNSYTLNGKIVREINAYDLMNFCPDCGNRFEYASVCPKCGSKNITFGYGEDTSVFLSLDNALDSITYTTDVDSIKNCIYLEAGDDLMTDTIRLCNPNGTNQLIYFHEDTLADMSEELQEKISSYMALYDDYTNTKNYNISVTEYNNLVSKYSSAPYNAEDIELIETPIVGFASLMNAMYDAIDMELFLDSKLLPSPENDEYTAVTEMTKLVNQLKSVAIQGTITVSSVSNAVLSMAKSIVMSGYQIKTSDEKLSGSVWTGTITITDYSDDEDTLSNSLTVTVNDDYEEFVYEQIQKVLAKGDSENYGIVALFENDLTDFKAEIKKYGLQPLLSLKNCSEGVVSVLAEQGILNKENYDTLNALDPDANKHLYNEVALPYLNKQAAINAEILIRENEIAVMTELQEEIEKARTNVQKTLNFETYVGEDLWAEFSSFRRDDTYSNSNYSSDGLTNAEIFKLANEFIEVANQEIQKAATPQHSITVTMKNILVMPEFEPMKEKFSVGNWIRVEADGKVHKLRLLSYEFNYNNYQGLPVTFSDVVKIADDTSDISSVLQNAQSMATSFDYVAQQANKGNESYKVQANWVQKGLDATALNIMNNADDQTMYFDRYGFLMRRINDFTGDYDPKQLKFINTTLAMTADNWRTIKTAVGLFQYYDPVDGVLKEGWGINGEMLIGKLILGEELGIYNTSGTLKFNNSGLTVTNGTNTFNFNPNSSALLSISNATENIFYVDENGVLHVKGDGAGLDISSNDSIKGLSSSITQTESNILASVSKTYATIVNVNNQVSDAITSANASTDEKLKSYATTAQLTSSIEVSEGKILNQVSETYVSNNGLTSILANYSTIEQTSNSIKLEVTAINKDISTITTSLGNKVDSDKVVSAINMSPETISINANKISLNGVVTANEYFKIETDGSMVAIAGYIGNWQIRKYTISAQKSTQKTELVKQPMTDADGNIIYDITYVTDENGDPVYETDENGNIIYETQYVTDADGNSVYETDENGNVIYDEIPVTDEEGNTIYIQEARVKTVQVPVQQTIQEIVYEEVEQEVDDFYNTYTVLSSNDSKIAMAVGVEEVDEDGIPIPSAGKLKIYNTGYLYSSRLVINRGSSEPCLYMERERTSGAITSSRMYVRNSDSPQFAFAFNKDKKNDSYIYSTIIDSYGVRSYTDGKASLGTKASRWKNIYGQNLYIDTSVSLPNVLNMSDDLGRKRTVIKLFSDGKTNNYGSNLLISAAGNTFVGSGNAPKYIYEKLFLNSPEERLILCTDTNIQFYVNCQSGDYRFAYLDNYLNFKPGTTATGSLGTSTLRWNNAYFEHSPTVTSDARHKKDIQPIYKAKELIMAIEPCQFRFIRDGADRIHYGLISQKFKETMDVLGIEDCGAWTCDLTSAAKNAGKTIETASEDEKMYGMRYEELIAPLIQVVQEQQKEINELKEMISQLLAG